MVPADGGVMSGLVNVVNFAGGDINKAKSAQETHESTAYFNIHGLYILSTQKVEYRVLKVR
jgi:hypothetical protein